MLVQCEMAHRLAKGGMRVLVGAHGVFIWRAMVHCSAKVKVGKSGCCESGGEVSDEDERENTVEPLNKPSCVQV